MSSIDSHYNGRFEPNYIGTKGKGEEQPEGLLDVPDELAGIDLESPPPVESEGPDTFFSRPASSLLDDHDFHSRGLRRSGRFLAEFPSSNFFSSTVTSPRPETKVPLFPEDEFSTASSSSSSGSSTTPYEERRFPFTAIAPRPETKVPLFRADEFSTASSSSSSGSSTTFYRELGSPAEPWPQLSEPGGAVVPSPGQTSLSLDMNVPCRRKNSQSGRSVAELTSSISSSSGDCRRVHVMQQRIPMQAVGMGLCAVSFCALSVAILQSQASLFMKCTGVGVSLTLAGFVYTRNKDKPIEPIANAAQSIFSQSQEQFEATIHQLSTDISTAYERKNFQELASSLKKASSLQKRDPLLFANFLEGIDREIFERLEKQDFLVENLLLQKDAIRIAFESYLSQIDSRSSQENNPECFICFALEPDVNKWLESTFVPDLDKVGVKSLFCFRDLGPGRELNAFQAHARKADLVVIACTPTIKQKCDERRENPYGVAGEMRLVIERFNDKDKYQTIYPIYLKGSRKSACPSVFIEPILGTKLNTESNLLSYYSSAFELFGQMRGVPREEARMMKREFIKQVSALLTKPIDRAQQMQVEEWRRQRKSTHQELIRGTYHRIQARVKFINLPLVPPEFTGRAKELATIHEKCKSRRRVAITGLGGVGKTALSLKYAEEHSSYYQFIHLVRSSNITQDLLKLADELSIPRGEDAERLEKLKIALSKLEREYLLIFDGIDEPKMFEELEKWMPSRGKCLLLTSRMPEKARSLGFEVTSLSLLEPKEAINYLVHQTKGANVSEKDRSHAAILAKKLDYLPLALKLAVSHIRGGGIRLEEYVDECEKWQLGCSHLNKQSSRRPSLKELSLRRPSLRESEQTILTTWKASLESIKKEMSGALAKQILEFCSFLEQAPISLDLIKQWHKKVFPKCEGPSFDVHRALGLLSSYSMVSRSAPDEYSIHQLVREVIISNYTNKRKKGFYHQAVVIFRDLMQEKNLGLLKDRRRVDSLIPHMEKVVSLSHKLFPRKQTVLDIIRLMGRYFYLDGKYTKALYYQMVALWKGQELLGDKHPTVATILGNVGVVRGALGKYEEALRYEKNALSLRIAQLGENHPSVARSLNSIGFTLGALGRHSEALSYQKQALKQTLSLAKNSLGGSYLNVARSLSNVGATHMAMGKHEEALLYEMRALSLRKKLLGDNHPSVAESLNNVGLTHKVLGSHEEALQYLMDALFSVRELLGNHPSVATNLNNVGLTLKALGRHEEALQYLMSALFSAKKFLGGYHPSVATNLNNVGLTLKDLGRHDEALECFTQSFKVLCFVFSEKHPNHENFLKNLIRCLKNQTDPQLVMKTKAEILPLAIEKLGQTHPLVRELESKDE